MRPILTRIWAARRAVLFYACLLIGGWLIGEQLLNIAIPDVRPINEPMIHRIVTISLVLFVLAAAIPFVPGAEIGFALLIAFGAKAAPVVYGAMVCALIVSYSVARLVPQASLAKILRHLGLARASELVNEFANTNVEDRVNFVARWVPGSIGKNALKNRYLLLALAINIPGNSVLGGGGGLAFFAAMSGLYRFWPFTLTVMCAVAPVPLAYALIWPT